MKRRGRGEGTIYKTKAGVWKSCANRGLTSAGKRSRLYFCGKTKREVQDRLTAYHAQMMTGTFVQPSRMTVAVHLEKWLADAVQSSVRPTTFRSYSGIVRNHIVPRIGGCNLTEVTPLRVQTFYADLERSGVSPRSRQLVHAVLHCSFINAVKLGLLLKNPCASVSKPRVPKKTMRVLSPDQVRTLINASRKGRLSSLYVLAVTTGLRQGELLGLQWTDINLEDGSLQVRHTLQEYGGELNLAEPKTPSSCRRVDLPMFVVASLREHRKEMLAERHPGPWVFCDTDGGPLRKSNLTRRDFKPLLEAAGLPPIRFHDLRHTAATLLLAQGVHPKIVQERLGHSSIAITLDIYSHVLPSMQRDAAQRLDDLLAESKIAS